VSRQEQQVPLRSWAGRNALLQLEKGRPTSNPGEIYLCLTVSKEGGIKTLLVVTYLELFVE
jgi:hypothetical protein